ncbi:MAG TPA: CDP-alcohol phosphatidyltransferase family protein [Acidimicrobiales bacterium]|nr:CDP-alcohol phosphatidyltransferase family protein [Acidimicrobiales bacterium]
MFDGRWREAVDRRTGPVGAVLQRHGVTADVLTATGLLSAVATAVAVATGHLIVAIFLLTLTGMHDLLDGPVAKAAGTASARGAFFDSVVDRVSDAVVMGGVAWYLISHHRGHLSLLPLGILGATSLVSYERAKAEALGIEGARGGLMERAERMILLGAGFLSSALLVPDLWVLLGLTSATAVGRFVRVWRAAEGPPSRVSVERGVRARWREGRVDSRWRAWREARWAGVPAARSGEPSGRWRARRRVAPLTSRSGRVRRARERRLGVGRPGGSSLS